MPIGGEDRRQISLVAIMASPDPPLRRLFVGIPLPDVIPASLSHLQTELPGFRWVPRDHLHLTLRFIGGVDIDLDESIKKVLSSILVEPFILPVCGIGCFPQKGRPRLVWIGVGNAHPRLFQLQSLIEDALIGLGIESETRAYHPHITIARTIKARPGSVRQFVRNQRGFEAPPFKVKSFTLFSSTLDSSGALYRNEATWSMREN